MESKVSHDIKLMLQSLKSFSTNHIIFLKISFYSQDFSVKRYTAVVKKNKMTLFTNVISNFSEKL